MSLHQACGLEQPDIKGKEADEHGEKEGDEHAQENEHPGGAAADVMFFSSLPILEEAKVPHIRFKEGADDGAADGLRGAAVQPGASGRSGRAADR